MVKLDAIQKRLIEEIADLHSVPSGAPLSKRRTLCSSLTPSRNASAVAAYLARSGSGRVTRSPFFGFRICSPTTLRVSRTPRVSHAR